MAKSLRKPSDKKGTPVKYNDETINLEELSLEELNSFAEENGIEFSNKKLNKPDKIKEIVARLEEDGAVSEDEGAESTEEEEKESSDDVQVQSSKPKTQKQESKVRVKLSRDLRTNIGGEWYDFKAGKVYTVPRTVKDILQRAGILEAI